MNRIGTAVRMCAKIDRLKSQEEVEQQRLQLAEQHLQMLVRALPKILAVKAAAAKFRPAVPNSVHRLDKAVNKLTSGLSCSHCKHQFADRVVWGLKGCHHTVCDGCYHSRCLPQRCCFVC